MAISVSIGVPIAGDVVQFSRFENRGEVREVLEGVEPQLWRSASVLKLCTIFYLRRVSTTHQHM